MIHIRHSALRIMKLSDSRIILRFINFRVRVRRSIAHAARNRLRQALRKPPKIDPTFRNRQQRLCSRVIWAVPLSNSMTGHTCVSVRSTHACIIARIDPTKDLLISVFQNDKNKNTKIIFCNATIVRLKSRSIASQSRNDEIKME